MNRLSNSTLSMNKNPSKSQEYQIGDIKFSEKIVKETNPYLGSDIRICLYIQLYRKDLITLANDEQKDEIEVMKRGNI